MSYSENPTINDIVLSIINDGDGSQCGLNYQARIKAVGTLVQGLTAFQAAAKEYGHWRVRHLGLLMPYPSERMQAARILFEYYENHVKELTAR